MAINPSNRYPNNVDPASTEYPYGKARDVTEAGDDTGTPFQEDLINDLFGFQQALLVESNTTPSGTPDTATNSQQLNAVKDITSKPVAAEFETILDLITGVSLNRGSNFDFASYIANGNRKVKTTYNNLTSKADGAEYIIKTLVQAAADGDVIDGTGSPDYLGVNHALSDGVHCAILSIPQVQNLVSLPEGRSIATSIVSLGRTGEQYLSKTTAILEWFSGDYTVISSHTEVFIDSLSDTVSIDFNPRIGSGRTLKFSVSVTGQGGLDWSWRNELHPCNFVENVF